MRADGRRSAAIAALVVTLILLPVAAWAAWDTAGPAELPDPDPRRPLRVDPLVQPAGRVVLEQIGSLRALAHAVGAPDIAALGRHRIGRVQTVITVRDGLRRAVWRFTPPAGAHPAAVRDDLTAELRRRAWLPAAAPNGGVAVLMTPAVRRPDPGAEPAMRGYYVRGRDVIRVDAYRVAGDGDIAAAFVETLDAQLAAFPADQPDAG